MIWSEFSINKVKKKLKVKWLSNHLIKYKIYPYDKLNGWKPANSSVSDIVNYIKKLRFINHEKIYYGKAVYNSKEINAVIKVLKNDGLSLVDAGKMLKNLKRL